MWGTNRYDGEIAVFALIDGRKTATSSSDDAKDAVDPTLLAAVRPSHESFYFS